MTNTGGTESRKTEGSARLRAGERFVALGIRARQFLRGRERLLFVAAFLLFCGALTFALLALPEVRLVWPWLALTATMVPLALVLNGIEYLIAARLLGYAVGAGEAMRISILASAANVLPIPGAVLVRTQALKEKGAAYGPALVTTGAIGTGWLSTAMILAGGLLLTSGRGRLSFALLVGGIAAGVLMLALIRTSRRSTLGPALAIFGTEALFVLVSAARLYGALQGVGIEASPVQAVTLTVAAAVAAVAGIFPEGLGLRELLAGGLSPLIGLPAAAGVLGAAADRLIGLAVLGVSSLLVLVAHRAEGDARIGSSSAKFGPGGRDQRKKGPGSA